jgi:ABC-2 type transport system ATP-binding protein
MGSPFDRTTTKRAAQLPLKSLNTVRIRNGELGPRMMELAVETLGLSKSYGKFVALHGLDIGVRSGEILVLLGPNGSGKTTLLHLISTVLKPSSGTARVMGYDIVKEPLKVREVVGISFQEPRGFWRHKPRGILSFHASIYGYEGQRRREVVERALHEFDLWESRDKRFMELSGGQAKRLEVAKQFIQRPRVAIFDEPTSMVDLAGKRMIWDKIRELRETGSTVVVATNEVREAEYLADRITIMSEGREVVTDNLRSLKDSIRGADIVDIEFSSSVGGRAVESLKGLEGTAKILQESDNRLRAYVTRSEDWLPLMMARASSESLKVTSVRVTEPSLDDIFLHYTGGTLADGADA